MPARWSSACAACTASTCKQTVARATTCICHQLFLNRLFENEINMINVKKAVFLFCAAIGFAGALGTAYAQPTFRECANALIECSEAGTASQCTFVSRYCAVYGMYI